VSATVFPAFRSPVEGDSAMEVGVWLIDGDAATTASMIPPLRDVEDVVATNPAWVADTIWYSDR
jgi:hypothetical protein